MARNDARQPEDPGIPRTGYIARVMLDRGFGFIRDDEKSTEYFFHATNCYDGAWERIVDSWPAEGTKGTPQPNIPVTFEAIDTTKGPRAKHVRIAA